MQWGVFGLGTQQRVMVLVISDSLINQSLEHVTVLPVVESADGREIYPNEAVCVVQVERGGSMDVTVLVHQVRTLRKSDLGHRIGVVVTPCYRRGILGALEVQLGVSITAVDQQEEEDDG